jgi:palmitoyltransferase ZDHHC1/11
MTLTSLLVSGCMATVINPTDALSLLGFIIQKEGLAVCGLCKSSVHTSSRHCARCNRCVDVFDHHCKWINNCIGRKNYKWFIISISSLMINSILILVTSTTLILKYINYESKIESLINGEENINTWVSIICLLIFYSFCVTFLSGNLVGIHIFLAFKGLTTFEYILLKRRQKIKKTLPENETISKDLEVISKIADLTDMNISG